MGLQIQTGLKETRHFITQETHQPTAETGQTGKHGLAFLIANLAQIIQRVHTPAQGVSEARPAAWG